MYYFEKLDLNKFEMLGQNADLTKALGNISVCDGGFSLEEFWQDAKAEIRRNLLEIIKIGAEFRRQLFDDYTFKIGTKSKLEADFECAMRIIEVIFENPEDFYVVRSRAGEIAGFWYLYGINWEQKADEFDSAKVHKVPVSCYFAGCLKKKFWGKPAREIMKKLLDEVFIGRDLRKLKCETFSTNPYIEGFLREFGFRLEGVLKEETMAANRVCDVKIWGFCKDEYIAC